VIVGIEALAGFEDPVPRIVVEGDPDRAFAATDARAGGIGDAVKLARRQRDRGDAGHGVLPGWHSPVE
jgi:hypothetical protein